MSLTEGKTERTKTGRCLCKTALFTNKSFLFFKEKLHNYIAFIESSCIKRYFFMGIELLKLFLKQAAYASLHRLAKF